ncbi:class I SAM-dependent methyltransferase [Nocardia sp. CNY236]|uniref:class I SAM-dependent methyltransferase n=1 Tax=Nocardia sp. CNY236 TaxID=1169152 RepID=UPI0018CB027E|nr:class I SAM-dependent methyltransferase [Nocardia sp. CNY236]
MRHAVDTLIDRFFRRPSGTIARGWWRDPVAHHRIFDEVLTALDPGPDDYLLEIGCGGGTFVDRALRSGCRATAVDHSADMVDLTRTRNAAAIQDGRLEVVQASAEHLPLADGRYTCATMMNAFFFMDGPAVLTQLRRVLAPGGRLVVHTVAPNPPATVAPGVLVRRMRCYEESELVSMLADAGFAEPRVEARGRSEQLLTAVAPA